MAILSGIIGFSVGFLAGFACCALCVQLKRDAHDNERAGNCQLTE